MFDEQIQGQAVEEDAIDLRDYLRILLKRWQIILTVFIIVVVVVLISTLSKVPQYQASTQLLIEKNKSIQLTDRYYSSYDPYFLDTQFELIKSENIIYRVIRDLKLDSTYRNHFFSAKKFSLIGSFKTGLSNILTFLIPKKKPTNTPADTAEDINKKSDAEIIASQLVGRITVSPVKETTIARVSFMHKDPVIAQLVTNGIAKAYMAELLEIKMQSSNYAVSWMTAKAGEEKIKLQKAEQTLQAYTRKNDIVTIENKIAITPQQLTNYSQKLTTAKTKRQELENIYQQILKRKNNFSTIENLPIFTNNADLQQLREKQLVLEQEIAELSKKFGTKHPLLIKAVEELKLSQKEKEKLIIRFIESTKNEYELARQAEANSEKLLEEAKLNTLNMNEKLIQYNILKREVDTNRIMFEALIKQIKEHSATEQTQAVNVFVIQQAKLPRTPATPNKSRNMMLAIVLGLVGGGAMAFFLEYLDNTISSTDDFEERFSLPVLGVIELVKDTDITITDIINEDSNSSVVENYRMIRSAIMLSSPDNVPKTILITSSIQGEGKTSTCINLARTLSMEGKSVLVVDCDLRRPRIHKTMQIENDFGLSTYLTGISKENIITSPSNENLRVIPSGPIPPNPAELLSSARMKRMLEVLGAKFDYILLDSAPILSVTDSYILSTIVDATILVVKADSTTYDLVGSTIKKLQNINAHLIGAVLNSKSKKKTSGYNYYYGGYYTDDYLKHRDDSSSRS